MKVVTVTKEYDKQGRIIKETTVIQEYPDHPVLNEIGWNPWYNPYSQVTCGTTTVTGG